MDRKNFLKSLSLASLAGLPPVRSLAGNLFFNSEEKNVSGFYQRLTPLHRLLEMENWYVWGTSPIIGNDGKTHVFFSRWPAAAGWRSWLTKCEIGHAVSSHPEGPYEFIGTALEPSGPGLWDAFTCHNPTIHKVGNKYALFYIGCADGTSTSQTIGVALADSLFGPWQKIYTPLITRGEEGEWDDHIVSNPAFLQHPDGLFYIYYKGRSSDSSRRSNFYYGLAISDKLAGPYKKIKDNPVIDLSYKGENVKLEDAYVFSEDGKFKMITRDMGYFDTYGGLYFESEDGFNWSGPERAYYGAEHYGLQHEMKSDHLLRKNRIERPQILMQKGKPTYLFTAMQGGKYNLSSSFLFKID